MSKYRLPNGLVVNLDDTTGETTVVGGGGRTIAPGARISPGGDISGRAATGSERSTFARMSAQMKDQDDQSLGIEAPADYGKDVLGRQRTQPVAIGRGADPMEVDPIAQGVVGGVVGAGAGAIAASAVPALAAPIVGGAVNGATQTAVQGGSPGDIAAGAAGGAVFGGAGPTKQAIGEAAAARNVARVPTAITGGATSKAAKAVVGSRDVLRETALAHPDLQRVILSGDEPAKIKAISGKLDTLTAANDADFDRIGAQHPAAVGGRVPTVDLLQKLQKFAQKAHDAGDESLLDATSKAIDSVQKFDMGGTISPSQIRGVRNGLAKKIAGAAPLSTVSRETGAVKGAINDALSDLADDTPGLDANALKERNRQIASLLPAKDFLEQKAETAAAKPPGAIAAAVRTLAHPADAAVHIAERAPSVIDQYLARLAGGDPAQHAALKAVALGPTAQTIRQAVASGVTPQLALRVARMAAGVQQPAVAQ